MKESASDFEYARYLIAVKVACALLFLTMLPFRLQAQTGRTVQGMITDNRNEPLAGVSVNLASTTIATLSTADGHFKITIPSTGSHQLRFTYIGFENLIHTVTENDSAHILIRMKPSTNQLNQVVVTAGKTGQEVKRLTVSTEIIKPYLIENKATTNLEKIMDQIPGVNVVDGQVNIRSGSGWTFGTGSRVLVLLDDMPYLSGDAGQVQWKFLPTENIEQVEVIKGAASVLYGSSALNGIVHIRTARPAVEPTLQFIVQSGYYDQPARDSSRWSSRLRYTHSVSAFATSRFGQNDVVVSTNLLKDEGYRWGEHDERARMSVHFTHHVKKIAGLKFGLNVSVITQSSSSFLLWDQFPAGAYVALDSNSTLARVNSFSADPHLDYHALGFKHRLRGRVLRISNDISSTDTSSQDQDNTSITYFGEYQVQRSMLKQLLSVTGGVTSSYVESDAPLYGGLHTQFNFAPYLQADIRWKRLNMVLGMRNESFRQDEASDNRSIYRAGLNVEVTRSTFFRTSYGEGYRYPAIAERYIQTSVGSLNIFPNNNLRPETGWNAEAGIKQGFKISNWSGFADVALFYTEYDDMVEFNFGIWKAINFTNPFASIGFKSYNVGRTRISGADYSLNAFGNIGKTSIRLLTGYTYSDAVSLEPDKVFTVDSFNNAYSYKFTSTDTSRNELKYRYTHMFKFDAEVGYAKFSAGISLRYNSYMKNIDRVFVSVPFTLYAPGIDRARELNKAGDYIWDARIAWQLKPWIRLSVIGNNLLNHEMMTRPADMRPPRQVFVQMMIRLARAQTADR